MAVIKCEFYSCSLSRTVEFTAVIPNDIPDFPLIELPPNPAFDRPAKTIYLLHGHGGRNTDWLYNSALPQIAGMFNVNFVMPAGENWFYTDSEMSDRNYCKFVGEELVNYTRKLFGFSEKKEDTFIGGYSMGGYGALHVGLSYPDTFEKIMALSNALIVHEVADMKPGSDNGVANYEYYRMLMGNPEEVLTSVNNPEQQILNLKKEGKRVPPIYLAIGTEDFLYENNQVFKKFLEEQEVEHIYTEGTGMHDFIFWNAHLPKAIEWFVG